MKTKTKSNRSKEFKSKLAAYSATARAAGITASTATAALLAAPAAHATIENITGLSVQLNVPQNAGIVSASFDAGPFHAAFEGQKQKFTTRTTLQWGYVKLSTDRASIAQTASGLTNPPARLANGASFAGLTFGRGGSLGFKSINTKNGTTQFGPGQFRTQSGYVALKNNSYYGWLKVKVGLDSNGIPNQVSLVGNGQGVFGAFDKISDTAKDGFKVGTTAASSVPDNGSTAELGGLALLALGAFGVREQRRRRQQAAGD